jgi:hypothetical protein
MALDLVMPNRQIVEVYVVFTELEEVKANSLTALQWFDSVAAANAVCPYLSNHEIFEKW